MRFGFTRAGLFPQARCAARREGREENTRLYRQENRLRRGPGFSRVAATADECRHSEQDPRCLTRRWTHHRCEAARRTTLPGRRGRQMFRSLLKSNSFHRGVRPPAWIRIDRSPEAMPAGLSRVRGTPMTQPAHPDRSRAVRHRSLRMRFLRIAAPAPVIPQSMTRD